MEHYIFITLRLVAVHLTVFILGLVADINVYTCKSFKEFDRQRNETAGHCCASEFEIGGSGNQCETNKIAFCSCTIVSYKI